MAASGNWSSSTIQPMYTTGGNVKQTVAIPSNKDKPDYLKMRGQYQAQMVLSSSIINTPTTSKYQGWSVAGIKRYNELYGMIDKERKSVVGIEFEEHFLEFCMNGKQASKQNHLQKKNIVYEACRHDLWECDAIGSNLDEIEAEKTMDYDSEQAEDSDGMKVSESVPVFKYLGNSDSENLEDDDKSCELSCGNDSVAGRND